MSEQLDKWDHLAQITYAVDGEPFPEIMRGLEAIHDHFKDADSEVEYPAYTVGRLAAVLLSNLTAEGITRREIVLKGLRAWLDSEEGMERMQALMRDEGQR